MKLQVLLFNSCLVLGVLLPKICFAELGGTTASILAEQREFNSQLSEAQQIGVTVYKQILPSGIIIQEYLSNNGTIFAVTWTGAALPNLQALLGNYFKDYLAAIKQSRGVISINSDSLVIQSAGMMGAFQGFAFLPKQAPTGFTSNNLAQ
jgi:hypothetical protein